MDDPPGSPTTRPATPFHPRGIYPSPTFGKPPRLHPHHSIHPLTLVNCNPPSPTTLPPRIETSIDNRKANYHFCFYESLGLSTFDFHMGRDSLSSRPIPSLRESVPYLGCVHFSNRRRLGGGGVVPHISRTIPFSVSKPANCALSIQYLRGII